jgi:uncharacterized protein YcfL
MKKTLNIVISIMLMATLLAACGSSQSERLLNGKYVREKPSYYIEIVNKEEYTIYESNISIKGTYVINGDKITMTNIFNDGTPAGTFECVLSEDKRSFRCPGPYNFVKVD